MNELPLSVFKHAIKTRYRSNSIFIRRQKVEVALGSNSIWDGEVLVFVLIDFSPPVFCYSWSMDSSVTCLLHAPLVESPEAAVRASLETSAVPNETRRIG